MTYLIRLTPDQYANVIANLAHIAMVAKQRCPGELGETIAEYADVTRETLWQEAEHPLQQACERAEAMGEEPF